MLLFHLIEDPIRRSSWLRANRAGDAEAAAVFHVKEPAAVGAALVVASLGLFVVSTPTEVDPGLQQVIAGVEPTGTQSRTATPAGPLQEALSSQLRTALAANTWPSLSPGLGVRCAHLGRGRQERLR